MNIPKGKYQTSQAEGQEMIDGDQISVIESIVNNPKDMVKTWGQFQRGLLEKRAMSDYLIDRWERKV